MTAVIATYASEPIMHDSAVQVPVNHLPDIRVIKAILPLKLILIDLFERFKMVLDALVIWGALGIALQVNRGRHGYHYSGSISSASSMVNRHPVF
jgi:hypothetical protein